MTVTQRGGLLSVGRRNVARQRRHGRAGAEADGSVVPGRIALEGEIARLRVIGESIVRISKGDAVGQDVIGRALVGFIAAAKFEAIAVTLERLEAPSASCASG